MNQDLFNSAGTFVGTFKGHSRVQLVGRDEYVGVANIETRDAAGNLLSSRCARIRSCG